MTHQLRQLSICLPVALLQAQDNGSGPEALWDETMGKCPYSAVEFIKNAQRFKLNVRRFTFQLQSWSERHLLKLDFIIGKSI